MFRLLNNLPIRVLFEENKDEGGGGKDKGNTVPQARVDELTREHKKELKKLQDQLDKIALDTKTAEEKKLGEEKRLEELLALKNKEIETLKAENVRLLEVETTFNTTQSNRWQTVREALKKSSPDQLKAMEGMSAFQKGETPADVTRNLQLYDDLSSANFFGAPANKRTTREDGKNGKTGDEKDPPLSLHERATAQLRPPADKA